ncbi:2,3-bisphosphoglycerate-dependent phosphoglycerate mutase [Capronia coronata CBS 617.96]|uniref:2,3-bisphosphoglycerate-dependent phosphoglycerate mutase n=1 Tax=Capronia coronata CBS 617.96 TaxID=1182541 RepID=W9YKT9_9EURO|nr:2,3-bisphosphoglycerate-dependent phosphoglycerate mutase [Capronia coronata CBS 617.96]EXJ93522.1 2,3-bisphosphoglycerate-dependent phosphoglycerate mutase [Capronia coronata CBS 617.96]
MARTTFLCSCKPAAHIAKTGQTEWSQNGRYTGMTDIPLLPQGEEKVRHTASIVFGEGRLIDPSKIAKVICSPRKRAQRTLELLLEQVPDAEIKQAVKSKTETTEDIGEWGYGDYEGLLTEQIRQLRKQRGLDTDRPWDIWRDGCEGPGGQSPAQVTERLDRLIAQITRLQEEGMKKQQKCDVVVVAHGHILRAFVKRWLEFSLDAKLEMMLEPGGVCGLSYAHGSIQQRAVLVGMSL